MWHEGHRQVRLQLRCCAAATSTSTAGRRSAPRESALSYNGGSPPLAVGGGSVVGTPTPAGEHTVHAIFWAPAGYQFPTGYEAGVDTYLTDVAADSGKASNGYPVSTQCADSLADNAPHITYDIHVGTPIDGTDPFPTTDTCVPDSAHSEPLTACDSDPQIHTDLADVLTALVMATGMGDVYLVIFPPPVESCVDSAGSTGGGSLLRHLLPGVLRLPQRRERGHGTGPLRCHPVPHRLQLLLWRP